MICKNQHNHSTRLYNVNVTTGPSSFQQIPKSVRSKTVGRQQGGAGCGWVGAVLTSTSAALFVWFLPALFACTFSSVVLLILRLWPLQDIIWPMMRLLSTNFRVLVMTEIDIHQCYCHCCPATWCGRRAKLTDWRKGQHGGEHGTFLYYRWLYHKEATKAPIPDAVKQQLTQLSLNHFVCLLEYNFSKMIA